MKIIAGNWKMNGSRSALREMQKSLMGISTENLVIFHCTSTYPSNNEEINLNVIPDFIKRFDVPIGYSGHERGITPSILSVAYGAVAVERHITIDRTLWGSDQAASLELEGLARMVRDIRQIPAIAGSGKKVVYNSELPIIQKLRRVKTVSV